MSLKLVFLLFLMYCFFLPLGEAQLISIDSIDGTEGSNVRSNFIFTVTRTGDLEKISSVKYATSNGTAVSGKDYEAQSGILIFESGVSTQTISIVVHGDTIDENAETFFVTLSSPVNASLGTAKGQATINDDDDAPTISIVNASIQETNAALASNMNVVLSQESSKTITVQYQTQDNTAIAPGDYTAKSGVLTFAPGVVKVPISLSIVGDTVAEPEESLLVNLKNPTNATLENAQGIFTIYNDDKSIAGITIDNPTITEGDSDAQKIKFTIRVLASINQTCSVDYKTADGTAKVDNGDYRAISGSVTFGPDDSEPKEIFVQINGDKAREANEIFYVNLTNPINAKIIKAQGKGTIVDNDSSPEVSISNAILQEPNPGTTAKANFVVTLSRITYETVTVKYATKDSDANAPNDYTAATGTLTFAPGTNNQNIAITVRGDNDEAETNEVFFVELTEPSKATLSANKKGSCIIKGKIFPEMELEGNGQSIADGDTEPSLGDHTDFGSCNVVGESVVRTFTISNKGSGTLHLNGTPKINITGENVTDFTATQPSESSIDPDGTLNIQITFNPVATGLRKATVSIVNNDSSENPYNFAIQGTATGTAPEMNVQGNGQDIVDGDTTPSTLDNTDFGNIPASSGTITRTFTIQNTGDAVLNLTETPKVSISGDNAGDFNVTVQPTSPVPVGRNGRGSATFTIVFDPSASGTRTATVSIANDDEDESSYDFAIQGTGTVNVPEMNVQGNNQDILNGDTTPSLSDHTDFGSVSVSSGKISRTFTIQNLGDAPLNLTGSPRVSMGGNHPADFTVTAQPASSVSASRGKIRGSTTFTVAFDPTNSGIRNVILSIANDDSDENPYEFTIQGTGLPPAPEINVQGNGENIADGDDSPSISDGTDFGEVRENETRPQIFVIQNTGDADLNLTGTPKVSISGTHASDFTVIAQPANPVFSHCNAIFQISFKPGATGTRTASVSIANDDTDENPYNFAIQGTGVWPEINIQGNGQNIINNDDTPSQSDHTDFGSASVINGTITRTFTIQNLGEADLRLSGNPLVSISSNDDDIDFAVTAQPAAIVTSGSNTTFKIKFTPGAKGIRTATISITNNDADESPYQFAIQGTGGDPADLDTSFNGTGKAITFISDLYDNCYSVAIQSDGKIVLAGYSYNGDNYDFAVVRHNANGSLDTSFNGTGIVTTPIGTSYDVGYSVAIQSDSKIVVAGKSYNGSDYDFAVVRYNTDGSLDTSFSDDGKVTTPIGSAIDIGYSVAIQSDGKIVVAGKSENGVYYDFAVVRYNTDGSLDTSFNDDGIVTTSIGSTNDIAYSVAIQSDGKIVVAGKYYNGSNYDFAVVRYTIHGSLDTSFNVPGISVNDNDSNSVAIQSDGKIVVAGNSSNGTDLDFVVVRYNTNGTLDTSFHGTGVVTTSIGSDDRGYSVAIQSDGKIVVAGYSDSGGTYDFAMVRYNTNGDLDTSFNGTGIVTTPIGSSTDYGQAVAIQSDGKIVVAGYSWCSYPDFSVARYLGDATRSPLSATRQDDVVTLSWESQRHEQTKEYNLYRSETEEGEYEQINAYPIPFEKSKEEAKSYTFLDTHAPRGKGLFYKLEAILLDKRNKIYPPVSTK